MSIHIYIYDRNHQRMALLFKSLKRRTICILLLYFAALLKSGVRMDLILPSQFAFRIAFLQTKNNVVTLGKKQGWVSVSIAAIRTMLCLDMMRVALHITELKCGSIDYNV